MRMPVIMFFLTIAFSIEIPTINADITQTIHALEGLRDKLTELSDNLIALKRNLNELKIEISKLKLTPLKIHGEWTFGENLSDSCAVQLGYYDDYANDNGVIHPLITIPMQPNMLKHASKHLADLLNGKTLEFYTQLRRPTTPTKACNTVFHEYLLKDRGILDQSDRLQQRGLIVNLNMGLFNGNGVTQNDLSFDQFTSIQVHYHHPCWSPNNARFTVIPDREISTFFIAGMNENATKAIVVYNLFVNTEAHAEKIYILFKQKNTFDEVLSELTNDAETLQPADKEALLGFVTTMQAMRTP